MKRSIGALGLALVTGVVFLTWWRREPETSLVDAAGNELTAGEPAGPVDGDTDPLFDPVRARIAARDFAAARADLLRVLEESERDGEACILLSEVTRELGEADEAVDWGKKAIELLPESAPAHLAYARALGLQMQENASGLGGMLGALRKLPTFKAEAARVVELDPSDTTARMMLVFTHLAPAPIGNGERALELAREIVPLDPVLGKRLVALCHQQAGDTAQAIEVCRAAMEEHPDSGVFHAQLADILVQEERFEEADVEYERAREHGKDEAYYRSLYYQAQWRIEESQDCERSIALLDEYIADDPHFEGLPAAHHALWRKGRALEILGRLPEARAAWQECLRRHPGDERAQASLAANGE